MLTEDQRNVVLETIAFAEKTVKIRAGVELRFYCDGVVLDEVLPEMEELFQAVCAEQYVSVEDVRCGARIKHLVAIKQIMVYLIRRNYHGVPLKNIALMMGSANHTGIVQNYKAAMNRLAHEEVWFVKKYNAAVIVFENLKKKINGSVQI